MTEMSHTDAAMRPLLQALETALNDFGQACYAFLPAPRTRDGLVIRIHHSLLGYSKHLVSSPPLAEVRAKSNHSAMEARAFENARCEDMDRIVALIQKLRPDLFSRETSCAVDLHGRHPKTGPRFLLEINGHPVHKKIGTAKSLVEALPEFYKGEGRPS